MHIIQIFTLFIVALFGSSATKVDLLKEYIEQVFNKHDLSNLDKYLEKDYIHQAATFPLMRRGGERQAIKSSEDFKKMLQRTFYAFPDLKVNIDDLVVDGNNAVYTATSRGRYQRSLPGSQATGQFMENQCSIHSRFTPGDNAKIAFTEVFCDFGGLMQAFIPAPSHYDAIEGRIVIDNPNAGIEKWMSSKVLKLSEAYTSRRPIEEIIPLHASGYKAVSPAYPKGLQVDKEAEFYNTWNNCMSDTAKDIESTIELQGFFFDSKLNGVTVTWKQTGVHSSKCPAPYDQYTPTGKSFVLEGVSWHQFDQEGLLVSKKTVFDNTWVKKQLSGKA